MSIPSLLKHSSGNAPSVPWRPETKWGWKCSISFLFFAPLMSVGSRDQVKQVTPDLKQLVKWVIFSFTVARGKINPKTFQEGQK